jgi:hypothetical protein
MGSSGLWRFVLLFSCSIVGCPAGMLCALALAARGGTILCADLFLHGTASPPCWHRYQPGIYIGILVLWECTLGRFPVG